MTAFLLILALRAGAETSCLARVAGRIAEVRSSFPALNGLNLVLEPYEGEDDFYRAWPGGLMNRGKAHRVYSIRVNVKACADAPPPDAERAIIAHELAHIEQYAAMGNYTVLRLGWEYWRRPEGEAVAIFEKTADHRAVKAGHAAGLAAYREWLYARLPPERVAVKRRLYLTPEELLPSPR